MLQRISTCKRDANFKHDEQEPWDVMNLNYLAKSPYLNHPIWFLGTMKNTQCPIHKGHQARNLGPTKNTPQNVVESATDTTSVSQHTVNTLLSTLLSHTVPQLASHNFKKCCLYHCLSSLDIILSGVIFTYMLHKLI